MIPQTTKWVIVSYADNAFAATAAQVKSQLEKDMISEDLMS